MIVYECKGFRHHTLIHLKIKYCLSNCYGHIFSYKQQNNAYLHDLGQLQEQHEH